MNDLWSYILKKLVHALLFSDAVGENKKKKEYNKILSQ